MTVVVSATVERARTDFTVAQTMLPPLAELRNCGPASPEATPVYLRLTPSARVRVTVIVSPFPTGSGEALAVARPNA